ncbi:MAG TPA: CcmD family protein [Limnochordales bacterium]
MAVLFFQVAYVLLWALLLGYVFYLGQRQHRLEQELGRLREELGRR